MKRNAMGAALSMLCLAAALSGCGDKRTVAAVRPDLTDPERFDCRAVTPAERPSLPTEDPIDLDRIAAQRTVPAATAVAREEVAAFVASVRSRELVAARYIVTVEGRLFECANDAAWARDYFSRLPAPPGAPD